MSVFTSSPYSLSKGTLIQAKIAAHNTNGWSDYSTVNTDITGVLA